jgi:hypothetical protein
MPKRMRRAAVLGATAHVASSRGQAKGAAAAAGGQPAPAPVAPADPTPAVPDPAPASPSAADSYDQLMRLKALLDAGALTQDEFEAEKQRILNP